MKREVIEGRQSQRGLLPLSAKTKRNGFKHSPFFISEADYMMSDMAYDHAHLQFKMSTNDDRYKQLRRKLDSCGYTQTLHPDSVELVAFLLKDNERVFADLRKEQKKSQQNKSNTNNPSVTMLQDQIDRLMAENKELKKQTDNSQISRQPDERTLKLQKQVFQMRAALESKITEFTSIIDGLEDEVKELKKDKEKLKKERDQYRSHNSQSQRELQDEKGELQILLEKKRIELREAEDKNGKYRIKVQVLEQSLEEARSYATQSKQSSKAQDNRLVAVLKQQLVEAEARTMQAKDEVNDLTAETDSLRRELRRAKDQVSALQSSQLKTQSYEQIDNVARQKYEQLIEQARQRLSDKCDEVRELKEKISGDEEQKGRLNAKIKETANKNRFLGDKNNDLQAEIQMVSGKLTMQVKKVRQLENNNYTLENQLKQMRQSSESDDAQGTRDRLNEEEARSKQLRTQVAVKEREISCLTEQLQFLRKDAEQKALQTDKVSAQNRKLQMIIGQGSKNLEALQLQKEELMRQNSELKTGKQQLTSADYQAKSELFVLREQLQSAEVQMEELRGAVKHAQAHHGQLEAEIKKMESQLAMGQEKRKQMFEDNQLMVGQIRVLEQRKNELHEKVKQLQERDQASTDEKCLTRQEVDQLLSECEQLKRLVATKDQNIRRMDMEKDDLQNQLDQETQRRAQYQQELAALKRSAEEYGRAMDQQQYTKIDLQRQLERIKTQKQELDRDLHRQCEEVVMLRDRLVHVQADNKNLCNQVNILTIANKENEREVERSRNRMTELDRRVKDTQRSYDEERERATATTIVHNELRNQLENERKECMRLQGFVEQLEAANNEMYEQLDVKDRQIQHMNNSLYDSKRTEEQLIRQIDSYIRSVQQLNADLEDSRNEIRRLGGDRQALRAERDWKKDLSTQGQANRLRQQERYMNLQQDFQRKTMDNDQLKQKNRQLQALLNEERSRNSRLSQGQGVGRSMMIESRVESYVENQNINYSNSSSRSRRATSRYVLDDCSEHSKPESVQSRENLRRIQEMYRETVTNQ